MKLNNLAKLICSMVKQDSVESKFLQDLTRTIERSQEDFMPSPYYKPSSIGGCMRNMYYQIVQAPLDNTPTDYSFAGICECGTARHEVLQTYVSKMADFGYDCKWEDVEEVVNKLKPEGTKVLKKSGMETKCFNEIYNLRFLCDGIISIGGEYYILEIKTESTYKFNSHEDAYPAHKMQATCYSIALGIDKVIFLYEDRDVLRKKTYLVNVTDEMKRDVIDKIMDCDNYVDDQVPPPKEADTKNCQYCKYKRQCREDGETE